MHQPPRPPPEAFLSARPSQPGSGLFGAAPAPAPAGGLFGATPAPAPGGLFGATPAARRPRPAAYSAQNRVRRDAGARGAALRREPAFGAPAPAGGLFGSTTTTGFGQQQTAPMPPGSLTAPTEPRPQGLGVDRAAFDLRAAIAEYTAQGQPNPDAKLATLCYDVAASQQAAQLLQRQRPASVPPERWAKFSLHNPDPDRCVPQPVVGFQALATRVERAQQALAKNEELARQVRAKAEVLLRAARLSDGVADELRARNATCSCGCYASRRRPRSRGARTSPCTRRSGGSRRGCASWNTTRSRRARRSTRCRGRVARAPAARAPALPAEDRARLEAALEAQHAGLAKLLDVARIDARDVGIMAKLREKSAAPRP